MIYGFNNFYRCYYLCYNMKKTSLATGLISSINQLPISDANT